MRRFLTLSAFAILTFAASAGAAERSLSKESFTFGTLTPPSEVKVRLEAANWLKGQGTFDRAAFDALWSNKDKPILDRLSATFELGDKDAAKALKEARNALSSAPTALPEVISDAKRPLFF